MAPKRFFFDSERSCVWVNARSSVHPINSETRGLRGWVEVVTADDDALDLRQPVNGLLEVSADRLSSGNQLYDLELRRRIDARTYPTIAGRITHVAATDMLQIYRVSGDLTFHGKTRSFEHEMRIAVTGSDIVMEGERVFDIREFGLKPPSMLMLKVYPEVAVKVELRGRLEE